MKKALVILILITSQLSCGVETCECEISIDEIEEIRSKLLAFKKEIGFHDFEQIYYRNKSIIREYRLEISNTFLNYEKVYKIVGESQSPFIETTLSKKNSVRKTYDSEPIKSNRINLSTQEWRSIDELIRQSCFWTKPVVREKNNENSILFYSLEGIDLERNICTDNVYHQIVRDSPRDEDLKDIINLILKFEPASDLDSLIRSELKEIQNK